jgi:hypothetical protein
LAMAAPMPREPPVMSATFSVNLDMKSPLFSVKQFAIALIQLTGILFESVRLPFDVALL